MKVLQGLWGMVYPSLEGAVSKIVNQCPFLLANPHFINLHLLGSANNTANTFSNGELYIPNYTSSSQKFISDDSVRENNATSGIDFLSAGLWTGTSAINTITLRVYGGSANLVQYSTFYLYGINNS
mgnify:CR=1 FL=1